MKVKTEPGLKTEEISNVFNELGAILNVFSQHKGIRSKAHGNDREKHRGKRPIRWDHP